MPGLEQQDKQARKAILNRVRQSLSSPARFPQARESRAPLASNLPLDHEALLQAFAVELAALQGVFHRCPPEKVFSLACEVIARAGGGETPGVLAWAEAGLPAAAEGLLDRLRQAGVRLVEGDVPLAGPERTARLAEMEGAVLGLTGAEAALADIGGIVVRSGAGQGRLASLLPVTHVALVTPDQFYPSLADWMEALRAQGRLEETVAGPSNLTVIAGPSRTADIEKTLVLGVHGPKTLHVICVE